MRLIRKAKTHAKMDARTRHWNVGREMRKDYLQKTKKGRKKEILVGGSEVIMVHIRRFLPRLYYYMASRVNPL